MFSLFRCMQMRLQASVGTLMYVRCVRVVKMTVSRFAGMI